MSGQNSLTLKWGTIKGWRLDSDEAMSLLRRHSELGASASLIAQHDTPEQQDIVCQLIDLCDTIYLDWDGKCVSREDAKKYVREYSHAD